VAGATAKAEARMSEQVARGNRFGEALRWLELQAPRLLAVGIVLWIAAIFVASIYKYETYGQGYDQVDFEQAIWNTTQGRPMEDSRFNFTGSVFGMDWMPMLFFFVPVYTLLPSAHALFFLQIAGAGMGAIPLYWLARDKLGSKIAGLGFGVAYLLYPVLLHGVLNPFQVRLFSVALLLFAFYWYEKGNWTLFWLCAGVAMLARSDVSFVIMMFGVYGLLTRRSWPQVVAPLAVGAAYFALSTFVLVPAFAYPGAFTPPAGPIKNPMECWPCGINPQLAYYGHLGRSGPEIIWNVVSHPLDTAQLVFTPEKIGYMVSLLLPVLFLPLLGARPLVLGMPILALNLLSTREAQYDYQHHYSLLLIPGIFAAAVYGAANLLGRRRTKDEGRRTEEIQNPGTLRVTKIQNSYLLAFALIVWGVIMQVPFKNPAVRAFLFPEPPATVAAANELVRMVPPEAKVAVSSKLAPHLLPRRYIYNFPPAPYSPYNFDGNRRPDYVDLDYILVDPDAAALPFEANKLDGRTGLEVLESLPEWEMIAEKEELRLYRRE
jgi:uncharacterized membrane protein